MPGRWRQRSSVVVAVAILVGVLVFLFRFLSNPGFSNDHYVHLARAQQMLLGGWPVRDFADPGMPLMYVVSALGLLTFGHSLFPETLLVFMAFGIAAGLSVWLAWRSGAPVVVACIAVLLQAMMNPRSYSYPKLLVYAVAIAACWRVIERPTTGRVVMLGAVVVAAFLFRHDHGLFVGLGAAIAIAGAAASVRARLTSAALCLGVIAGLLLPWAVYVHVEQGIPSYFTSALEFSRAEAARTKVDLPVLTLDRQAAYWTWHWAPVDRPVIHVRWRSHVSDADIVAKEQALGLERIQHHEGRTWRYHPDVNRLDALLADPAVDDTGHVDAARPHWWRPVVRFAGGMLGSPGPGLRLDANSQTYLFYLFVLLPVAFLILAAVPGSPLDGQPGARARIIVVAALALMIDAAFLRDPLNARLPDVVVPQTLLGAWALAVGFRRRPTMQRGVRILVPLTAIVLLLVTATAANAVGRATEQLDRIGPLQPLGLLAEARAMTQALRTKYDERRMPSRAAAALVPVFEYLQACTRPRDRFMYVGFGPDLYFYAQRGFAGGHVAFFGDYYSSDSEQLLIRKRLAAERVPLVIAPEGGMEYLREALPIVAEYLTGLYRPVADINIGDRRATILADTTLRSSGTYAQTGWPCFQ